MNCPNIGIFGGTFNPVHIGHLIIAQEVKEKMNLEKIVFVPSGNPPHKLIKVSKEDRLEMLRLAIEDNKDFLIEEYEINKSTKSYSLETVDYLEGKYNCKNLYFIVGEDSFMEIEKWYRYEELLSKVRLIVVNRKTKYKEILQEKMTSFNEKGYITKWVKIPNLEISSSYIREEFEQGRNPRYYIPTNTYEYIRTRGIYDK
ncbi:nicotinate (nicotinamide) nucleotide adenylyltransferase [Lagierella sp.]|uniref:nicotinate (nicotinamide) nucleotide adenylyltransferase n=1 Tax=Lagierella sp. TaxID=2849657 RepID=UPI0026074E30|nr:nicotinate (nicotinamide) nucleotide adenylyltransferase [Lagierella sp.]